MYVALDSSGLSTSTLSEIIEEDRTNFIDQMKAQEKTSEVPHLPSLLTPEEQMPNSLYKAAASWAQRENIHLMVTKHLSGWQMTLCHFLDEKIDP